MLCCFIARYLHNWSLIYLHRLGILVVYTILPRVVIWGVVALVVFRPHYGFLLLVVPLQTNQG